MSKTTRLLLGAVALLLQGCISVDYPVLDPKRSVSASELIGWWSPISLVEAAPEGRLRATLFDDKGKPYYSGPVHVARLQKNVYLLEHMQGLELKTVDDSGLREVTIAVSQAEVLTRAKRHKLDVGFARQGESAISSVYGAGGNQDRIVAFFNDLIVSGALIPSGAALQRSAEAKTAQSRRSEALRWIDEREGRYKKALASLTTADGQQRSYACREMTDLFTAGHVEATAQWGLCQLHGWSATPNKDTGKKLLASAGAFGSLLGRFEELKLFLESPNPTSRESAMRLIEEMAAYNYRPAMDHVARVNSEHLATKERHASTREQVAKTANDERKMREAEAKGRQERLASPAPREPARNIWIYQTDDKGSHTANVYATEGRAQMHISVDSRGERTAFYRPGSGSCDSRPCYVVAEFDGSRPVVVFTTKRVAGRTDWLLINEAGKLVGMLLISKDVLMEVTTDSSGTVADPNPFFSDAFLISGKLDPGRVGFRSR